MSEFLVEVAGWAGALALLNSYILVSWDRLSAHGRGFQWLNMAGAAGLIVNGAWHQAWPSVGLNVVWVAFGLLAIQRLKPSSAAPGAGSPQAD